MAEEVEPASAITPVAMPTQLSLVPAASSPIKMPAPGSGADFNTPATAIATSSGTTSITFSQVKGSIMMGSMVGAGVPANTSIVAQVSGPTGGAGVYTTNNVTTLAGVPVTISAVLQIDPGGDSPPIVVNPATHIPGETFIKTLGTFPYTLVLPTFAYLPLVQGVKFNLSAVPPWKTAGVAPQPTPPPVLTMTRTPPFPAYPS